MTIMNREVESGIAVTTVKRRGRFNNAKTYTHRVYVTGEKTWFEKYTYIFDPSKGESVAKTTRRYSDGRGIVVVRS